MNIKAVKHNNGLTILPHHLGRDPTFSFDDSIGGYSRYKNLESQHIFRTFNPPLSAMLKSYCAGFNRYRFKSVSLDDLKNRTGYNTTLLIELCGQNKNG